jgi:cytochrome P450
MIAGGSDTTMVTLTWAIALLLNNPHKLKRAQDELDAEIGRERVVSESDMSKLVYIQAIVKETLRLYPAAPLSAPHEFTEDCTIGGYNVLKGTRLITNLWKIQTDPKKWPDDPLEFKPERFLTTHKDVDVRGQHFELIPFGSGRRACPGLSFGIQIVQFTLASFLHAFQIASPSNNINAPIDMTESFGLTNVKATPLEVLIKPRLCRNVYR